MQTLSIGSFVNLDKREKVEALKFTAAALAEHAAKAVAEAMTATALANLANSFWEKAEYVTRETERRQLQQIFVENFTARFVELKPLAANENAVIETASSELQTDAGEIAELNSGELNDDAAAASQITPLEIDGEMQTAVTGRDEFLGFVKGDEEANVTPETSAAETSAENEQVLTSPVQLSAQAEQPKVAANEEITESKTIEAAEPQTSGAAKSGSPVNAKSSIANAGQTAKEPFEFEKCSINLNLNLLPVGESGNLRRVIISASSHNLPPEIDLLEIAEGGDLTAIAELVRDKLLRFKQTLPAKYIEQLRQSKTKSAAKKSPTAKAASVSVQPANNQPPVSKESGEKKVVQTGTQENNRPESSAKANGTSVSAVQTVTAAHADKRTASASSDIQPSLF